MQDVKSLLPDELRTEIESESAERIFLACTKLSLQSFFCESSYSLCDSYQLTDLRPLASFTQLISLDLNGEKYENNSYSYGKLSDIGILANFTNLTELNLGGNSITDLSPLATLTQLKVLYLSDNPITDLSPLSALKNLTDLKLDGIHLTEETDFSLLLALTQLQSLDLSRNLIGDRSIEMIARLTTLKNLDVRYNRITNIRPLETLPNLVKLDSYRAWDW